MASSLQCKLRVPQGRVRVELRLAPLLPLLQQRLHFSHQGPRQVRSRRATWARRWWTGLGLCSEATWVARRRLQEVAERHRRSPLPA